MAGGRLALVDTEGPPSMSTRRTAPGWGPSPRHREYSIHYCSARSRGQRVGTLKRPCPELVETASYIPPTARRASIRMAVWCSHPSSSNPSRLYWISPSGARKKVVG